MYIQLIDNFKKFMKWVCVKKKLLITEPNPPTNLSCPQSPLDVSLEISWIAPAEPNGIIRMYQINVNQGSLGQVYTLSNETHKKVEGLSPGTIK